MKIYEIGTGYTPIPAQMGAATEIVVEELTKAFLKLGQQVEILDIASGDRGETELPIREVPVPGCFRGTDVKLGILHKLKRVVYSVCLAHTLKKLLKDTREQVVLHFHNQYNLFFFLKLTPKSLRRKAVLAYTNHSGVWRQEWSKIEKTIRKRYFQEAECMRKADILFLLNEETKHNVTEHLGISGKSVVLIGNGVNTDIYHPLTPEEKLAAKEKFGFSGKKIILQVGSVYENKGQLRAVEYLLPLLREDPELVYVFAGGIVDEAYYQKIRQNVKQQTIENSVCYLGMVSPGRELNTLYNAADATILLSNFEAFGLVAVESLSAGIPVITGEKLQAYFGDGCISCRPELLTEILKDMYAHKDTYAALCCAARNNAIRNYSWNRTAEEYAAAFRKRMKENV